MPARVGFVWFPLSFPFADRGGSGSASILASRSRGNRIRRQRILLRLSLPQTLLRPTALPSSEKRPSASESFFCQGQNNSLLPLATQYSACQGQKSPSAPLAKQKSSYRGRKYPSAPLGSCRRSCEPQETRKTFSLTYFHIMLYANTPMHIYTGMFT